MGRSGRDLRRAKRVWQPPHPGVPTLERKAGGSEGGPEPTSGHLNGLWQLRGGAFGAVSGQLEAVARDLEPLGTLPEL